MILNATFSNRNFFEKDFRKKNYLEYFSDNLRTLFSAEFSFNCGHTDSSEYYTEKCYITLRPGVYIIKLFDIIYANAAYCF